jgi:predicted nuclease with RNAse H fold
MPDARPPPRRPSPMGPALAPDGGGAAAERVVGIDFAGPAKARDQRRKILAVLAERAAPRRWVVPPAGLNARLLRSPPGWTAGELADALVAMAPAPSVVGADFPFCVPRALLARASFAAAAGHGGAFGTWSAFNAAVARRIPLACPVDYGPFRGWRRKRLWLKRACDVPAGAHAPLKDRFQVLFNMTLLGNAFLRRLARSGRFDVVPFQARGRTPVVEVYPGHALRALGVPGYKRAPRRALRAIVAHLASRGVALEIDRDVLAACEAYDTGGAAAHDHDAADALVAAAIAVLYREGLAREIAGPAARARDRDGAIWSVSAPEPTRGPARSGRRRDRRIRRASRSRRRGR